MNAIDDVYEIMRLHAAVLLKYQLQLVGDFHLMFDIPIHGAL
jgi:hypothetical protein